MKARIGCSKPATPPPSCFHFLLPKSTPLVVPRCLTAAYADVPGKVSSKKQAGAGGGAGAGWGVEGGRRVVMLVMLYTLLFWRTDFSPWKWQNELPLQPCAHTGRTTWTQWGFKDERERRTWSWDRKAARGGGRGEVGRRSGGLIGVHYTCVRNSQWKEKNWLPKGLF